jgi:phytol kinase
VGYLAAGWGDAIGEPVGARWGRHRYRVPSLAGVAATRSWEGSAAVFAVATLGSTIALAGVGGAPWWGGFACGAAAAFVEGISNHGLDNLTVQIVPSVAAMLLFGGAA